MKNLAILLFSAACTVFMWLGAARDGDFYLAGAACGFVVFRLITGTACPVVWLMTRLGAKGLACPVDRAGKD